jgi:ATP/maltotriose-dependent transcriptional regulator MalT/two-component SAPR family response regulator
MAAQLPITRTKLLIPQRRRELLSRPRLLELLSELLDFRLIIIAAPAGYGKTSLLIDFASNFDWPVCWVSLDALDNDPMRFLSHFVMSIRRQFPEFGEEAINMLKSTPADQLNSDYLISALTNDIYEQIAEHFVVVLDDYHLVNANEEIDQFLSDFIQRADDNCHIAITSRKLLTLPDLPLMVARAQVGGLSIEELVFQPPEIQKLYSQVFNREIDVREAEQIAAASEGWITGLLLTSPMLRSGLGEPVKIARASGIGLYEYLAQQVLDQQPQDIRDFLLNTSILEEFNAEMCREVVGRALSIKADWPRLMDTIYHHNLFVLPVDEEYRWLRYHHLFRDFLQSTLASQRPQDAEKIKLELARYAERNLEWEKVFEIYRQLDRKEAIAELIERIGSEFIAKGKIKKLSSWLDELTPAVIAENPKLLSIQASVSVNQGQIQQGKDTLDQVVKMLRGGNHTAQLATNLIRRSAAHRVLGNYAEAGQDAEEAIQLTNSSAKLAPSYSEALRAKGVLLYQTGMLKEGLEYLNRALDVCRKLNNTEDQARILVEIGAAYERLGNFKAAEEAYQSSLKHWQAVGDSIWIPTILNNLGVLQHSSGEFVSSFYSLEKSLKYSQVTGNQRMEGYALASIGDLYKDLEAMEEAEDAYQKAIEVAQQIEDQFLVFYIKTAMARLSIARHDLKKASLQIQTAQSMARRSGSSFDTFKISLEKCALEFASGKYADIIEELELAEKYFTQEGHIEDSVRSQALLMAALTRLPELLRAAKLIDQFIEGMGLPARRIPSQVVLNELQGILKPLLNKKEIGSGISTLFIYVEEFRKLTQKSRRKIRKEASVVQFGPPRLEIRSLGRMEIAINNRPLTISDWKTQTSRDLFFLFLAHPEGLNKEEVGELMWGELSPAELKLRFKNAIYRMRHAIGSEAVLFIDNYYQFNRSIDYEYDVQNFLSISDQAREEKISDKRVDLLKQALDIYQGPYLPEIGELWAEPDRQRYHEMHIANVIALTRLLIEHGALDEGLSFVQKALKLDPYNEELHRLAMQIFSLTGNKTAVAKQYQILSKSLRDQIDAPPSEETAVLYRRLMS